MPTAFTALRTGFRSLVSIVQEVDRERRETRFT
jgi:hypothetical protein